MREQPTRWKETCRTGTLLLGLALSSGALGLEWRTGDVVRVASGEVIRDDLYVSGEDVQLDGVVTGDLIASGGTLRIGGEVRGNVWAAGQRVLLGGKVTGSSRIAGSVLEVGKGAAVGRDLLAAGMGLDVARGARVGGDLAFGGAQTRLNGTVARNAYVGASAVEVGGTVGGDARFAVDNRASVPQGWPSGVARPEPLAPGLTFTGGGRVNGDLTLRMPDRPALPAAAVGGEVTYAPPSQRSAPNMQAPVTGAALKLLRDFAGIALAGLLLAGLARVPLGTVGNRLRQLPGASLGYGALTFLGFPLVVLALSGVTVSVAILLTVLGLGNLGLPLALIGAPVLLGFGALIAWAGWFAAQGLAAFLLGGWLITTAQPGQSPRPFAAVLIGGLLLAVLAQLPVVGPLVTLGALLLGLGAVWLWWRGPRDPRPRVGTLPTPHPA